MICEVSDMKSAKPATASASWPRQITERFARRADGELEPLTEGLTMPIAQTVRHAGIVKVNRYGLDMAFWA
jgi:hypothetical protein